MMTKKEFRESQEYKNVVDKIRRYNKGFRFTLEYCKIPESRLRALRVVMDDCVQQGLIESERIGVALDGTIVDETFKRL